ncbi:MAG: DeoR/GlpR family DNA-binding transcription regulator [Spirochaetaceae bacterium]
MNEGERPLQPERLEKIQELLENRHTVKVNELSEALEVSENTIRRDLVRLEKAGICFRTKGGAGLMQAGTAGAVFSRRLTRNREAKIRMAEAAAQMVHSGDSVILDSGTTAFELALKLREKEHITVITPSLEAAQALSGYPDLTLILSGGIVHATSRSMTGPPAETFFETVHADTLFLTVKAISLQDGLTDHTMAEASVKRKMIRCSGKIVVLADHSKIGKTALSRVGGLETIDTLITDGSRDPQVLEVLEDLRTRGIEVIITAHKDEENI